MHNHSFSLSHTHLRVDAVSVLFPDRRVLTDISFTVSSGQRIGLIGENGSGKSTLLRVAAGLLEPNSGSVHLVGGAGGSNSGSGGSGSSSASIGLLHQEAPFHPADSVREALESAVAEQRLSLRELDRAAEAFAALPEDDALAEAYAEALATAERLDAWNTDSRVASMLAGLGLDRLDPERRTDHLSGGQRARLALAWLLLRGPDILLLDEPTNHLDDAAVAHLRRELAAWRGPVLFASHDRSFLDENATGLVDLDPSARPRAQIHTEADEPGSGYGVTVHTGNYSDYLAARSAARTRWERQYRDEQAELRRLRAAVGDNQIVGHEEWRPRTEVRAAQKHYADRNAKVVARRVNDARSRLAELESAQVRQPPQQLRFAGVTHGINESAAATQAAEIQAAAIQAETAQAWATQAVSDPTQESPIVMAREIAVTHRLNAVSLQLGNQQKLLLTGANGVGKSTLLKVIAGELSADSGALNVRPGARIGMLSQDVQLADPYRRGAARTVIECYRDALGEVLSEQHPLDRIGLIAERDFERPVLQLSLGQQRRLELAILLADPPELLLLDEPSNHLSLAIVTELEQAITEYPGAVIIASHDRWLREHWQHGHLHLAG